MAWEVTSEASSDVRRAMGVSNDVRGLGRAMGVFLVASSDVRGLGGAMGVVSAMPEAWEVTSEEQWVCLVTSEDWEGQWVCLQ